MEPRPMNKPIIQGLTIKADMHPTSAKFMVGDQELMVMGADIRMRPDEVITATIEVPIEHIDVELMTSGVTIASVTDEENKGKTAYVVVSDDAPQEVVREAIKRRAQELDKKLPMVPFEIKVIRQSDIAKL